MSGPRRGDGAVSRGRVDGLGEVLAEPDTRRPAFEVHLTNFEGPFDLLLQLISRRKLDITEVAL